MAWGNSDVFDWQKFPEHQLDAAPVAYKFSESVNDAVPTFFANLAEVEDWEDSLDDSTTQAFIVIQDGTIVYEGYFNGTQRDSIVTSFSMAKSFTSALVGIAIDEGYIESVEDPITDYLPQ